MEPCAETFEAVQQWDLVTADSGGFQIQLRSMKALCVTAAGNGHELQLADCGSTGQTFTSRDYGVNGTDVAGDLCDCWNVNDFNARSVPRRPIGFEVQCYSCVDSGSDGFNPNQRFQLPESNGSIRAWKGYAPNFCVTARAGSRPPPPPPPPWYLGEDYTDRHGSFLEHEGQVINGHH